MRRDSIGLLEPLPLPPDDEQDEPLAAQEHGLTIDNLHYPLYTRLRGPACCVAEEIRLYRDAAALRRQEYVAPDLLVALGVPDRVRPRYIVADEGKAPDLVVEVLSESSTDNGDLTRKRAIYQGLGVREYVVVDPLGGFAPEPRLQAWRFEAAPAGLLHVLPDADGVLRSRIIPFGWTVRDDWVRLVDLASGDVLPLLWELAAEQQARQAEERRQAAEEQRQAARAEARAERARARAAEGRARRAEAEAARLLAELERLRRGQAEQG